MRRSRAYRQGIAAVGVAFLGTTGMMGLSGAIGAASGAAQVSLVSAYRTTVQAASAKETISETVTTEGKSVTVKGVGEAEATGNARLQITADGESIRELMSNGILYISVPSTQRSALHVSTPWVSLNLNTIAQSQVGSSYAQLVSESQQTPAQSLGILQAASGTGVHEVGTSTLFGDKVSEYRADVDLSKAASAEGKPQLAPMYQNLENQFGISSIPVTVWLDAQNRIRQMQFHLKVPKTATHEAVTVSGTVALPKFGIAVHAEPPPSDQVTDVTAQALASAPNTAPTTVPPTTPA